MLVAAWWDNLVMLSILVSWYEIRCQLKIYTEPLQIIIVTIKDETLVPFEVISSGCNVLVPFQ